MKKVLSLVLVIVMLCSNFAGVNIVSTAADLPATGSCGDSATYAFDSVSGLLTISGTGGMNNYSDKTKLPFYNQKGIKHVIIEKSITSIANYAFFGCSNLEDISITVDETGKMSYIGNHAFEGCTSLKEFTIPYYATRVGNYAFADCTALTEIKTIAGCQFFSAENGILYNRNKTSLYSYPGGKMDCSCSIRGTVTTISPGAFQGCLNIESVIVPTSVSLIDEYAFKNCSNIIELTIQKSLKQIKLTAFEGCQNIERILYDGTEEEWDSIISTNALNKDKVVFTVCKAHIFDEGEYDIEPTCIKEGQITYKCKNCPQTKTEVVGPLGHTEVVDEAIPATCTTTGLTEGKHCSVCQEIIISQTIINATGHSVVVDNEVPATCVSTGLTQGEHCGICGAVLIRQEKIPLKQHRTETINYRAPTCDVEGYTGDEYCLVCQQVVDRGTSIPKLIRVDAEGRFLLLKNHIIQNGLIDGNGYRYILDQQTISDVIYLYRITYAAQYAKFVLSLTTSDGVNINLIIDENGSKMAFVDFSWGKLLSANSRFETKSYSKDSLVRFEKSEQGDGTLGLTDEHIQSLCNSSLKTAFYCWDLLLLENLYFDVNMGDLGFSAFEDHGKHTWNGGVVTKAATCTGTGIRTYTCTVCGESFTEPIAALGHTPAATVKENEKAPTCTAAGSYEEVIKCSVCGEELSRTTKTVPAIGHTYKAFTTKPTGTTLGYTTHTCSLCGDSYKDTFTAPTGKVGGFKCKTRTVNAETVQWTGVKSASGYQVQISTKDGKKWDKYYNLKAGVTNYTFKSLAAGNAYKFRVRFFIKAADGKAYYSPWSSTLTSPTVPTGTSLTKVTAGSKAFTANWKKNAAVNGYQIQYSLKSNFSGAKTVTVKSNKTLKTTVKKLNAKKVYYVRIRTYKTIAKVNYYSSWSKVLKVKTK